MRARHQARVVLLRHGEPDWTPGGGPSVSDPGLTPLGVAQARATARRIADRGVDAIYVSPYRRSQETAAELAELTGIEPVTIDGLAEVGVDVDGLDQEEVDRYFVEGSKRPLKQHWDGWPQAESFHDFHRRVAGAVKDLLGRHDCHPIREEDWTVWRLPERKPRLIVVAHGGTNAVALTHLLDIRPVPWEWLRFESELCAYSVLQARPLGPDGFVWSLQNFNEVDPLAAAGLRSARRPVREKHMAGIRIYHNPGCSKSRAALAILQERETDSEVIEYLATPLGRDTLAGLLERLPDPPAELVRRDKKFEALGLDPENYRSADAVVGLLLDHPELMQRPVVVRGDRAVIARPPERVLELL